MSNLQNVNLTNVCQELKEQASGGQKFEERLKLLEQIATKADDLVNSRKVPRGFSSGQTTTELQYLLYRLQMLELQ